MTFGDLTFSFEHALRHCWPRGLHTIYSCHQFINLPFFCQFWWEWEWLKLMYVEIWIHYFFFRTPLSLFVNGKRFEWWTHMVIWNSENSHAHQFLKYLQRMLSADVVLNWSPCWLNMCVSYLVLNYWASELLAISSHTERKKIEGRISIIQKKV